ncbi:RICIN domain-containing protein [Nocardiopsis sp. CNT312]|uniref:RICIN domain-containing protein n=1 Tax=Nocardiopsis sp. CNT312 TaxID=1137268 RepID=UPI0004B18140|nr:RICIN domain-containing protein [Nocardiopsis sp. CNT312]
MFDRFERAVLPPGPRWPWIAGAVALFLAVAISGYAVGALVPVEEPEEPAMNVASGILVAPVGASEEPVGEPSEQPSEEPSEEPAHPAGIDPAAVYMLSNVNGGRVLDVAGAATGNGSPVHLWDRLDQPNQQWRFIPVEGGFYELEGVASGKLLQVSTDPAQGPTATLLTRTGSPNQHWTVADVGGGVVRLVNRQSGQVLTGQGAGQGNGTAVVQAPGTQQAHQHWRLVPMGS